MSKSWPIEECPLEHSVCETKIEDIFDAVDKGETETYEEAAPEEEEKKEEVEAEVEEEEEEEKKPEGWYSATEMYSPVIVDYEIASFKAKHIYAICNMMAVEGENEAGSIRLVQFPGHPVKAKTELEDLDPETEYKIRTNLYGSMGDQCELTGPEFNPLREINSYGEQNPY